MCPSGASASRVASLFGALYFFVAFIPGRGQGQQEQNDWYIASYSHTPETVNLAIGCDPSAGVDKYNFRVGMSVSVTGRLKDDTVTYNVKASLFYWYRHWNLDAIPKSVLFCVMDDNSDIAKARYIYESFVNGKFGVRMDLLLGPSTFLFREMAAGVADAGRVVIMLWSTPPEYHTLFDFVNSSSSYTSLQSRRDNPPQHEPSQGRHVHRDKSVDPDGHIFDQGYRYVFETAIPPSKYTQDALDKLKQQGAESIVFLDIVSTSLDAPATHTPCLSALDVAKDLGYSTDSGDLLFADFQNFTEAVGILRLAEPDILVICGDLEWFQSLANMMKYYDYLPGAIVSAVPLTEETLDYVPGFVLNYFISPFPIKPFWVASPHGFSTVSTSLVFGNFDPTIEFANLFGYPMEALPPVVPLQLVVIPDMIAPVIEDCRPGVTADLLMTKLREHIFDQKGKLVEPLMATMQFFPVPERTQESRAWKFVRHSSSQPSIVHNVSGSVSVYWHTMFSFSDITYPSPNWVDKVTKVNPCRPGCIIADLVNSTCAPCQRGTYRREWNEMCVRISEPLQYADEEGQPYPKVCEVGMVCNASTPWESPIAAAGYYRIRTKYHEPLLDPCVQSRVSEALFTFSQCSVPENCLQGNVCKGANIGFLCDECEEGYAFFGLSLGARACRQCPSSLLRSALLACMLSVFICVCGLLSWCSCHSAPMSRSLSLPMLRTILNHLHILCAIAEVTSMERYKVSYLLFANPLADIMSRPLDVFIGDCIWKDYGGASKVEKMLTLTMAVLPVGYAMIFGAHFFAWGYRRIVLSTYPGEVQMRVLARKCNFEQQVTVKHASAFLRDCIAWSLLTYPICVRKCMQITVCTTSEGQPRLRVEPELECGDGDAARLSRVATVYSMLVGLGLPVVLQLLVFQKLRILDTLDIRRQLGILFIGFRPDTVFYNALVMLRTSAILLMIGQLRTEWHAWNMLMILLACAMLWAQQRPQQDNDRSALHCLEMSSVLCLVITLVLGSILQLPFWETSNFSPVVSREFSLEYGQMLTECAAIANTCWIFIAFLSILYNEVVIPLHIASCARKPSLAKSMLLCIARGLWGLNATQLVESQGLNEERSVVLDMESLNDSEMSFMARTLEHALFACVQSKSHVDLSLLMTLVKEAVNLAGTARTAAHFAGLVYKERYVPVVRNQTIDELTRQGFAVDEVHHLIIDMSMELFEGYVDVLRTGKYSERSVQSESLVQDTAPVAASSQHGSSLLGIEAKSAKAVNSFHDLDELVESNVGDMSRFDRTDGILRYPLDLKVVINDAKFEIGELRRRLMVCKSMKLQKVGRGNLERSPLARGVELLTLPNSSASVIPTNSGSPDCLDSAPACPGPQILGASTGPDNMRSTTAFCITTGAPATVVSSVMEEEALELYFDVASNPIRLGAFNAALLTGLRALGATVDATSQLRLTQLDSLSGICMELRGPASAVRLVRSVDLPSLVVMGCALRRVLPLGCVHPTLPMSSVGRDTPTSTPVPAVTTAGITPHVNEDALQHPVCSGIEGHVNNKHSVLVDAILNGRQLDAYRELKRLESTGFNPIRCVSSVEVERVRRIGTRYMETMETLGSFGSASDWVSDRSDEVIIGFKLSDGALNVVSTSEHSGCSALQAFAALQELDISGEFNKDLVSARVLSQQHASDTIWHIVTCSRTFGSKEDNILRVSSVDALDEVLSALWVGMYTFGEQELPPEGVISPKPQPGMNRLTLSVTAYCIEPLLTMPHGAGAPGFRLTVSTHSRPPSVVYNLMRMMRSSELLRTLRGEAERFAVGLREHIACSSPLAERLQSSPRAEFYEKVRQRLNACSIAYALRHNPA